MVLRVRVDIVVTGGSVQAGVRGTFVNVLLVSEPSNFFSASLKLITTKLERLPFVRSFRIV